ncbi:MAG: MBL fold metallo-hydrolase [Chitinophagaceae bacterium]
MLTVKGFVFSPFEENTYVLYNEAGECCIVDPGCYQSNERNELKDFISESQLRPKYLLNTHCHLDHVFGNSFINETYGLVPHIHPNEKLVLDFAPLAAAQYGLSFSNYTGDLTYITETDVMRLGKDELKIILAPGHSPGHVCFYCEAQQFLIGGDVLFRESIGRSDLPGGDFKTLENSIREKLYVLPPEMKVYPGHGPFTTIGHEMANNPYVTG